MLELSIINKQQNQHFDHGSGPLEFGRGPRREARRILIKDSYVSRDQLCIEERERSKLWLENLSTRRKIVFQDGTSLEPGTQTELELPVSLSVGETLIHIKSALREDLDQRSLTAVANPWRSGRGSADLAKSLLLLGESPPPEKLTHWLETIISLERLGADLTGFYQRSARALVELIGLDVGMVIVLNNEEWSLAAGHAVHDDVPLHFSRTLVNHVVNERQTFYQELDKLVSQTTSLESVSALVASPIFGIRDEVAGVLYGARTRARRGRLGVTSLEAQVVQLMAAVVGANLARSTAARTRIQFEQFFSPELVEELERDPNLLEGRNQTVTILCSDLRGFTALSERLGAEITCRLIRDLMEQLTERIVEQGGVIVDYAGDGILAMWNAPVAQADHANRACRAALLMQSEMPAINERWKNDIGEPLRLGIGLNTGTAQVGNTGSNRKFKYGPHGHTVNLASRVQNATKKVDAPILITGSTFDLVADSFHAHAAGEFELAGVKGAIPLFSLIRESSSVSALSEV